ncbi:hypothetical protein FJU08_01410 [Martelella alba]|uniref:Uncharacterized protein n=1 Tax=Martelella alba TaxID=2590451 RepID=A0A506UIU9_9HYPH|nr:hypothetical protein [Martelella alba]TPW33249.1 hypothetical protein FJU08_01410 [Martelella alba]
MVTKTLTADGETNFGIEAACDKGYRVLSYSGSLGGGTLRIYTKLQDDDAVAVPVADAKLSAANVDDNGDVIQQVVFISVGNVLVTLSGSTSPNAVVSVA